GNLAPVFQSELLVFVPHRNTLSPSWCCTSFVNSGDPLVPSARAAIGCANAKLHRIAEPRIDVDWVPAFAGMTFDFCRALEGYRSFFPTPRSAASGLLRLRLAMTGFF
ncbi:MAG: hypothetical protein ABJM25_06565, partial [Parvibaculum sp.]|uniref:hypothetical protein n=1 Tax=Parvibaculum sp. TaxID=2024848 RepID=UPI0032968497